MLAVTLGVVDHESRSRSLTTGIATRSPRRVALATPREPSVDGRTANRRGRAPETWGPTAHSWFRPRDSGLRDSYMASDQNGGAHRSALPIAGDRRDLRGTRPGPALAGRHSELRALGQVAFDVRLLVSELVANSVRHAGLAEPTDRVKLELSDSRLRVEVRDPGEVRVPRRGPRSSAVEGGRGLQIVAAIAHRWGIDRDEPIAVWFEIDLERTTAVGARRSRECASSLVQRGA